MTNPNQDDARLSHLSDDYIRNLEPENQRYDITLAQDFVISVLPNGIKTWAFIYDFQGRHRRKTLGVFPEMNFEDAKVALEKARASMLRMDEPTVAPNEFGQLPAVLGGGKYIPKKKRTPFNWLRLFKILGGLVVLAALAGAALLAAREWQQYSARSSTAEPAPEAEVAKPSLPFTLDTKMQPKNDAPDTNNRAAPATTPPASRSSSSPQTSAAQTSTSGGRSNPVPAPAQADSTPAVPPGAAAPTTGSGRSSSTNENASSASKPVTTLTTTTKATAFGGRVSRSRLTSRVQDLEPTDTLGPEISYKNSGFTRVFYFTELREFSDGTVVHRWSLNGEPQEEVVLNVRKSWRWRTYSNKDITPGLNGEWKVETIDATGKILDTETFTYDYQ